MCSLPRISRRSTGGDRSRIYSLLGRRGGAESAEINTHHRQIARKIPAARAGEGAVHLSSLIPLAERRRQEGRLAGHAVSVRRYGRRSQGQAVVTARLV